MATIEKIANGYHLIKAAYKHNGNDYYRNEAGQWFYDEAMTQELEPDPLYTVDEQDEQMITRFQRDARLNSYIDAGTDDTLFDEFSDSINAAGAELGAPLYATRAGKVTASASADAKQFGVMPADDTDVCDLHCNYCDALMALI